MKEISIDELRMIQLDIVQALHVFCNQNCIHYSLNYGTLIGAIRHNGFIPWDDDIDICMLRSDYEKLEKYFPDVYKGRYKFLTLKRDSKWNRPYAKMYDSNTLEIEEIANNYKGIGVGVDIFPLDNVFGDIDQIKSFHFIRKFLIKTHILKGLKISNRRSMINNILLAVSKIILFPFSSRRLALMIDKYIQKFNNKSVDCVFSCSDSLGAKNHFPKRCFNSYLEVPFEDRYFKIMEGYDCYLNCIYDNYKKLPPEEKRVSHHRFKVWWKDYVL